MTKKVVDHEAGTVTFTFDDESTESFSLVQVDAATNRRLALHGASQKVGDSYAGAAAAADPLAYAKESVRDTIAQLYAGDWRVSAGGGGPRISDLATALARVTGKTVEEATAIVEALDDAQKKVLRKQAKVASAIAAISVERATAKAAKLAEAAANAPELTF